MEYKFDNDFRFKNLPDESTPINADNLNKALDNTSWLKSQLDGTIEQMSGSNIEITECAEAMLNKLEIEGKSVQDGEPSPDNPIEIKSVGYTNLFNKENYVKASNVGFDVSNLVIGKTYTFSSNLPIIGFKISTNWGGYNSVARIDANGFTTYTFQMAKHADIPETSNQYLFFRIQGTTPVQDISELEGYNIQIVEGTKEKKYIPYGKYELELIISNDTETKTITFVLNEPLRSLPDGTKDLLYMKGRRLYVNRNVGSAKVNLEYVTNVGTLRGAVFTPSPVKDKNVFNEGHSYSENAQYGNDTGQYYENPGNFIFLGNENDTINTLKEKYDDSELIYKLEEPIIEDLGEIQMPITYKEKSTITTTDELAPNINLEYVKDTILTDYIEKRLISLIK